MQLGKDLYKALILRYEHAIADAKARLKIVTITDTATIYDGIKEDFFLDALKGKMKFLSNDNQSLYLYLNNLDPPYRKEVHLFTDMQSTLFNNKGKLKGEWEIFIHAIMNIRTYLNFSVYMKGV